MREGFQTRMDEMGRYALAFYGEEKEKLLDCVNKIFGEMEDVR